MASLLTIPCISGISSPIWADCCHSLLSPHQLCVVDLNLLQGREGAAHRLVLFTLLTGVLLSSRMISVDITSAQHAADSTAVSHSDDIMAGLQLTTIFIINESTEFFVNESACFFWSVTCQEIDLSINTMSRKPRTTFLKNWYFVQRLGLVHFRNYFRTKTKG